MRRREFITLLGGAATAWPLAARAQQASRVRRIGVLMPGTESDQDGQSRVTAFQQGLAKLGWTDARNVQIDYRWGALDPDRMRTFATELVGLRPDVLFAGNTTALAALQRATRSIPIVFTLVADPIGGGFVASLARPGGNITGFMGTEAPLAGKWMQLLKEITPGMRRAAFLFNPEAAPYAGEYFRFAETAASSLAVELIAAAVHDQTEIDGALATLAREPNYGLIVMPDAFTRLHRERIIAIAAKHRLPVIYPDRSFATVGGLISYGSESPDVGYRQATSYVDRILRGEKPADLPVQALTKYELVINLKTAKALGLKVSPDMLSIADEVIE
jgi:putative tryptophan/tyrosine transport system substrate-binding protein